MQEHSGKRSSSSRYDLNVEMSGHVEREEVDSIFFSPRKRQGVRQEVYGSPCNLYQKGSAIGNARAFRIKLAVDAQYLHVTTVVVFAQAKLPTKNATAMPTVTLRLEDIGDDIQVWDEITQDLVP